MKELRPDRPTPGAHAKQHRRWPGSSTARTAWLTVIIVALAAGIFFLFSSQFKQSKTPPGRPASPSQQIPNVRFVDVTREAGIVFKHWNGAYGEKLLPECMGGGCAFFDCDNDGDQDLIFVGTSGWAWRPPHGSPPSALALFINDGTGAFSDATASSGLQTFFYGMGVATGDFNNDGFTDLFATGVGENHLFQNLGQGKFQEVSQAAGIVGPTNQWSTSAAFFDCDRDGDLDLFVCNYLEWTREIDLKVNYQLPGIGRAYGPPLNFPSTFPLLYRNDGNGRFTDVSAQAGIQVRKPASDAPMAKSLGVSPVDVDADGWIDLIVANDTVQNFVFHNQRNGTFKEIGAVSGIALDLYGGARGAMGIDSSRIQKDNSLAVAIGNFANEMTALYVSQQNPMLFSDEAIVQGIGAVTRPLLTFGVFFFDYDLDGWLDLLTANGHLEEEIHRVYPEQRYRQPAQLFWNLHGGSNRKGFVPVPPEKCGSDLFQPMVGRGSAYADIDSDGDLDVVIAQINGSPLLLKNSRSETANWLRFKLVGRKSNRDAIGAWVHVRAGLEQFSRQVMPTRGYLSQSELPITIGLKDRLTFDEAVVVWPTGRTQALSKPLLNQITLVEEKL